MLHRRNKPAKRHLNRLNRRGSGRTSLLIFLLVWAVVIGVIAVNKQNIIDWWELHNYQAPAVVAKLATQDTMTAYARKIYYVNHPLIDDKAAFNSACPNNDAQQTIVLGCYHSGQAGIFLYNVTDSQLNGVEQVTAAHEMLHAAYARLSSAERAKVDTMLQDYYNRYVRDPRIISEMASYKRTEPNAVHDELHSVIGTEIATLPSQVEQYYSRYFTSRPVIAAYAAQYQATFTSRQATVSQDDAQLVPLKSEIDSLKTDLITKQGQLNAQQAQLTAERSSPLAYNAAVPAYNSLVVTFNSEIDTTQNLISRYNNLVAARNAVALQEQQLVNNISSSGVPAAK